MGGSGTRAVARILMHTRRYMGERRNVPQEDSLDFAAFDYRWSPPYLLTRARGERLPPDEAARMRRDFETARGRHLEGLGGSEPSWGWKHSPSIHVLPFLHETYPGFRFVHVIRDGRDAAFGQSGGRTHVLRLGRAVLDGDPTPVTPESPAWTGRAPTLNGEEEATPLRQALFWARVNTECQSYAEAHLGDAYLPLRLEDLCERPDETLRMLLAFAEPGGVGTEVMEAALATIETPPTIGRWRREQPQAIVQVVDAAGPALERFGYLR